MTPFEQAYAFVRRWEGGDSEPRPGDPNPTRWGITQATYDAMCATMGWPEKPVHTLTEADAEAFYRTLWVRALCGTMPHPLGMVHFDAVVNLGERQAVKLLQLAVGEMADGIMGAKTAAAIRKADARAAAGEAISQRDRFYTDLAKQRPDKARWLKGWLNRTKDLRKAVAA